MVSSAISSSWFLTNVNEARSAFKGTKIKQVIDPKRNFPWQPALTVWLNPYLLGSIIKLKYLIKNKRENRFNQDNRIKRHFYNETCFSDHMSIFCVLHKQYLLKCELKFLNRLAFIKIIWNKIKICKSSNKVIYKKIGLFHNISQLADCIFLTFIVLLPFRDQSKSRGLDDNQTIFDICH